MSMRIFVLILLLCSNNLYSQTYDSIELKKIQVNGFTLGAKKDDLVKHFGEPKKVVTVESAPGKDLYSNYYYQKNRLRVSPVSTFNGFRLTEDDFVLTCGEFTVKPGDSLKEFAINFPVSFQTFTKHKTDKFKLRIKGTNSTIIFKIKKEIIEEIEVKEEAP
jgi:hypothetical protein